MFETDRLDKGHVARCNKMHEVWLSRKSLERRRVALNVLTALRVPTIRLVTPVLVLFRG
jgi:hypothetical protein